MLSPFVGQQLSPLLSAGAESKEDLLVLKELLEAGKVAPVIERTYPLNKTAEAVGYVGERYTHGKVVINV